MIGFTKRNCKNPESKWINKIALLNQFLPANATEMIAHRG